MKDLILGEFRSHQETIRLTIESLLPVIQVAATMAIEAIRGGKKIIFCGNGGSAADAQHLAAELSGRYLKERVGLPGIAITTDSSALTAIANDYGFDMVFSRQVEAIASAGDLLVGISTSGKSPNVIKAFETARKIGCGTIGLSGRDGGQFGDICDLSIVVPSAETARIQETHILIGHIVCLLIEASV